MFLDEKLRRGGANEIHRYRDSVPHGRCGGCVPNVEILGEANASVHTALSILGLTE